MNSKDFLVLIIDYLVLNSVSKKAGEPFVTIGTNDFEFGVKE